MGDLECKEERQDNDNKSEESGGMGGTIKTVSPGERGRCEGLQKKEKGFPEERSWHEASWSLAVAAVEGPIWLAVAGVLF